MHVVRNAESTSRSAAGSSIRVRKTLNAVKRAAISLRIQAEPLASQHIGTQRDVDLSEERLIRLPSI